MTTEQQSSTIVMTGCSGFIGEALIERLSADYDIVGLDVVGPPEGDVDFVEFDITSEHSVGAGLEHVRSEYGGTIASVIHLAAFYDFSGAPSPKYREINIEGTGRMLDALCDFEVEQFLFTSTMLVHKPGEPGERIDEEWPLQTKWPYPKSQVEAEKLIEQRRGEIPALILRVAGVYNDGGNSLPVANQIARIFERRITAHVYPGDLSRGQSFLHQDDLADAVERAVARRHEMPDRLPMLVGEPDVMGYGEIQKMVGCHLHGEKWTTLRVPKPLAKAGAWIQDNTPIAGDPFIKPWMVDLADDHYALDITRACHKLGWEPEKRLRDVLPRMVEALKADPLAWYRNHQFDVPGFLEAEERAAQQRAAGERVPQPSQAQPMSEDGQMPLTRAESPGRTHRRR